VNPDPDRDTDFDDGKVEKLNTGTISVYSKGQRPLDLDPKKKYL
jgi:hypothetical protein